jgi:hypothetical protein
VAGVVVGAALGHAGHHRENRLGPVGSLDLGLLVRAQHDGLLRRVVVQPHDIDDLTANSGSLEILNPSLRCGLMAKRRQIRPTVDLDRPDFLAMEARDQCVTAPSGFSSSVLTTTSSTLSSRIDGGRPSCGSSVSPSRRCAVNQPPPPGDRVLGRPQVRRHLLALQFHPDHDR